MTCGGKYGLNKFRNTLQSSGADSTVKCLQRAEQNTRNFFILIYYLLPINTTDKFFPLLSRMYSVIAIES